MVNTQKTLLKTAGIFLNKSEEEIKEMIKKNTERAIEHWNKKKDIEDFYKTTDVYIYGLIDFCSQDRIDNILMPVRFTRNVKILDFGGGIGIFSVILSAMGNNVTYHDLPGITQDYAIFLNKMCGTKVIFENDKKKIFAQKYYVIMALDVLEHLNKPMETVKKLTNCLTKKGIFLTTGLNFSVGPDTPMHLPENLKYQKEYTKYMVKHYTIVYLYVTGKEMVYGWVKK